jgi:hypothetical protein
MRQNVVLLALATVISLADVAAAAGPSQADIDICRQEAQFAVSLRTGPSAGVGPLTSAIRPPAGAPSPPIPSPQTGTAPSAPSLSPGTSVQTGDSGAEFQDAFSRCLARRTGTTR